MRKTTTETQKMYFFSDRLKRQLAQIPHYPLTLIEAPSGFGKTTAVREFLKANLPEGARECWYTCLAEPAAQAWSNFCDLLSNVNAEAAESLKKLGMPSADMLMYLKSHLRDCRCTRETYLVIDNYQLFDCAIHHELISIFSMHACPNVHFVFITQYLETKPQITFHNANIYTIEPASFFFDKEGTACLFRMENIHLSEKELQRVYEGTEGWIAAIRLQIINYRETGSFDYTADIDRLVETAIWNKLSGEEKEFLLVICVKDGFNVPQAARMMGREALSEKIMKMLKSNEFIRFFPREKVYTIHSILQDFLRNQFYNQPREFQNRILRHAGYCSADDGDLVTAAQYFYKVKDFDALLSLPFDGSYMTNHKGKDFQSIVESVIRECPEEKLGNYPFILLIFTYAILLGGRAEDFSKLCAQLFKIIETKGDHLGEKLLRRLKGEFFLMLSLSEYNDLKKMTEGIKVALGIFESPSAVLSIDLPWSFVCPSIACLFWREAGGLDEAARELEVYLQYARRLTSGLGSGMSTAMKAEVMLLRGEDEQAKILCHTALYEARSKRQICICLSAELILARIAILRGDVDGYFTAVENLQNYVKEIPQLYVMRMVDLCMGVLYTILDMREGIAKWLYDLDGIEKAMYAKSAPYAEILYAHILLSQSRYSELYGLSCALIDKAKSINYIYPQIYYHLFLAAAKHKNKSDAEAAKHIKEALSLAIPDRGYLPFVHMWNHIGTLMETAGGPSGRLSPAGGDGAAALREIKALHKRQAGGVLTIRKAVFQSRSPLSRREREVALLARERLSNKEIADKLYISDMTVKTILQNIYDKLDVHSKFELSGKNF